MAGLVPAIHVFRRCIVGKAWMPGTSLHSGRAERGPAWPGMTERDPHPNPLPIGEREHAR
jgi:hypothetical protein